jgi:hypothetical protein
MPDKGTEGEDDGLLKFQGSLQNDIKEKEELSPRKQTVDKKKEVNQRIRELDLRQQNSRKWHNEYLCTNYEHLLGKGYISYRLWQSKTSI